MEDNRDRRVIRPEDIAPNATAADLRRARRQIKLAGEQIRAAGESFRQAGEAIRKLNADVSSADLLGADDEPGQSE